MTLNTTQIPESCLASVSGSTFVNADCFDVFPFIEDNSIDAIICDLPYGTTACKWDSILPFDKLWEQYERIIKPNGAIVLFGSEPFSSALRMSNIKNYKYDWIWDKKQSTGGLTAKKRPMKAHEDIMVFNSKFYFPVMGGWTEKEKGRMRKSDYIGLNNKGEHLKNATLIIDGKDKKIERGKYPQSLIRINGIAKCSKKEKREHPTQKPVELMEYLIKTYTNEGDMVLDNTMGSGSTGVACVNTNRKFIGIEMDKNYFDIAQNRIMETITKGCA
jgi:site-specific DNA-methyltransferase (adenine-specific)